MLTLQWFVLKLNSYIWETVLLRPETEGRGDSCTESIWYLCITYIFHSISSLLHSCVCMSLQINKCFSVFIPLASGFTAPAVALKASHFCLRSVILSRFPTDTSETSSTKLRFKWAIYSKNNETGAGRYWHIPSPSLMLSFPTCEHFVWGLPFEVLVHFAEAVNWQNCSENVPRKGSEGFRLAWIETIAELWWLCNKYTIVSSGRKHIHNLEGVGPKCFNAPWQWSGNCILWKILQPHLALSYHRTISGFGELGNRSFLKGPIVFTVGWEREMTSIVNLTFLLSRDLLR